MAIVTNNSRVFFALSMKNLSSSTYLAIGKSTPWDNENIPPSPDPITTGLTEIIGYKKVDKVSLCRVLKEGETTNYPTISYGTFTYVLIPDDKAYTENATLIYYEAEVLGTDLPLGTYRQVGIYTNVVPKSGVTKPNLLPTEVQDKGILQFFDNRQQQNRTEEVKIKERFIVTMEPNK